MTIDWNDLWRTTMERHLASKHIGKEDLYWSSRERVAQFNGHIKKNDWAKGRRIMESMDISPRSRVLDIGAGPGTLVIPLARIVSHVTAVEPAPYMIEFLEKNIREESVENVDYLQKAWEEVDPEDDLGGDYDIVVASYSLGMYDIRSAIEKMVDISTGYVYLLWFSGLTSWDELYLKAWPRIHGHEYLPGPKVNILYNVLYDMGIYPTMEVTKMEMAMTYDSVDDAVDELQGRFVAKDEAKRSDLASFLDEVLREENGMYVLDVYQWRTLVWWHRDDISGRYDDGVR
jgi:SAM-dependent methyltransferase